MLIKLKNLIKGKKTDFSLIGVDKNFVFDGLTKCPLIDFCLSPISNERLVVCTRKEASILLETRVLPHVKIVVLEVILPFLDKVKYFEDCSKNYKQLNSFARKFDYFIPMGFFCTLQNKYHRKLLKKVPKKEDCDNLFIKTPHSSIQEVYIFKEQRKSRTILAFDFNSMFGWGMLGTFSNPARLKYKEINSAVSNILDLPLGAYHVSLCGSDDFIRKFFPLTTKKIGKSYYFKLGERECWNGWLTREELNFYSKHFNNIFIYEGVISDEKIKHPFSKICERLYKERNHFKNQNNKTHSTLCKLEIACLHAIPVPTFKSVKFIRDTTDLKNMFQRRLGIDVENNFDLLFQFCSYINLKSNFHFRLTKQESTKNRGLINLLRNTPYIYLKERNENASIFSLFSEVIGRVRTKLLETIEYISSFHGSEICYVNIDSIHVSIPLDSRENFLEHMKPLIGQEIGLLKIEAEAAQGLWVNPGIYSLKDKEQIISNKIRGVTSKLNQETDLLQRVYINSLLTSNLNIPVYSKISLGKVIGLKSQLENSVSKDFIRFKRFSLSDINTPSLLKGKLQKIREEEIPLILKKWKDFHSL